MSIPVFRQEPRSLVAPEALHLNYAHVTEYLVRFLQDECIRLRNTSRAIIGLSGGVDSAVTTALAARAFGPKNVHCFRLPYKLSSQASLDHAQLVIDELGVCAETIDISAMVDGYLATQSEPSATRIGNVCARCRANILFDQSARLSGLPLGTGNKTERLFGYFTWHADDTPPINPLGDLFKVQVWGLARFLGVPEAIINKPATADLVQGQTDEGDFGISYERADPILNALLHGYPPADLVDEGVTAEEIEIVSRRVRNTHWKRKLATVATLSDTSIGEFYLRPVDYREF